MDYRCLGPAAGRRVAVVGGCGGIGRAYVEGLLAAECRVAVLDRASAFDAAPAPDGVEAFAVDAMDETAMSAVFAKLDEIWGGLDVLAHVAGINPPYASVENITDDQFAFVMKVNLHTALIASRLALPLLRKSDAAAMVFVSSGLGVNPEPGFGAYAMSKAAMIALVKTLAKENAPAIRANAVAPGVVDTAFLSGGTGSGGEQGKRGMFDEMGAQRDRILASIPMRRMAVAQDVAGPMLFLSGDASRYMTGQTLYINGGRLMP
jgi:3-oxoacyl-[acyl-carrier protein] reductase